MIDYCVLLGKPIQYLKYNDSDLLSCGLICLCSPYLLTELDSNDYNANDDVLVFFLLLNA